MKSKKALKKMKKGMAVEDNTLYHTYRIIDGEIYMCRKSNGCFITDEEFLEFEVDFIVVDERDERIKTLEVLLSQSNDENKALRKEAISKNQKLKNASKRYDAITEQLEDCSNMTTEQALKIINIETMLHSSKSVIGQKNIVISYLEEKIGILT